MGSDIRAINNQNYILTLLNSQSIEKPQKTNIHKTGLGKAEHEICPVCILEKYSLSDGDQSLWEIRDVSLKISL